MSAPFRHRIRVRWPECDMQGIVFYGHYLAYFDLGITELFRHAIGPWGTLLEHDADLVVGEVQLRYRASARFDDEIDLVVSISKLGNTSMTTAIAIERAGELLVEGSLRHVCIDPKTMAKRELPAFLREGLAPFVSAPADGDGGAGDRGAGADGDRGTVDADASGSAAAPDAVR